MKIVTMCSAVGLAACGMIAGCSDSSSTEAVPGMEDGGSGDGGTGEEGKVELRVWLHDSRDELRDTYELLADEFNRNSATTTIVVEAIPEAEYAARVAEAADASELPCVLEFDGPFMARYAATGSLIPLDDYVNPTMRADFLPTILAQGTYEGKLYSLGAFDSGLAIWGNRRHLEAAGVRIPTSIDPQSPDGPWSRQEFLDALAALQALPEVEYAIDMKVHYGGEWNTYGFSPILQSFGGDLVARDFSGASGVVNGPDAVEAMTFLQGIFDAGYANPNQTAEDDDAFFAPGKENVALSYVGHWMWLSHARLGDDLVLIPMPAFGTQPVTGLGSWNWGISANCEYPDESWQFLDFLMNERNVLLIANSSGGPPARRSSALQSELYSEGGALRLFIEQLDGQVAIERPVHPAYPVITESFSSAVAAIIGGANVQSELDGAASAIDAELERW